MATPFLGAISMMSFGFAPKGWALCDGQTMAISQNAALFSLLGTTYGGNGTTTFQLPNLQSQVPIHFGQGSGLSNYTQGQAGGTENVTLTTTTIPTHTHTLNVTTTNATAAAIASNLLPAVPTVASAAFYAVPGSPSLETQNLAATSVSTAGGSQPHNNMMPSLCISFVIALQGIFPSQN